MLWIEDRLDYLPHERLDDPKEPEHCRTPKRGRHSERQLSLALWSAAVLRRF